MTRWQSACQKHLEFSVPTIIVKGKM